MTIRGDQLPVRPLLAIATYQFSRYVLARHLNHPEIDAFISHWWLFHDPAVPFEVWESTQPDLIFTALGDPFPDGFETYLQEKAEPIDKFRWLITCITEICYVNYQGRPNREETLRFFNTLNQMTADIVPYDLDLQIFSPYISNDFGWGKTLDSNIIRALTTSQ